MRIKGTWAAVILAAGLAQAVLAAPNEKPAAQDLSDASLDQRRETMDARLAARAAAVERQAEEIERFQAEIKNDRLGFERHMSEEQKAFYLYMKSMGLDERQAALDQFEDKQAKKRNKFDRELLLRQREWFAAVIEKPWQTRSVALEAPLAPKPGAASVAADSSPSAAATPVRIAPKRIATKKAANDDSN